MQPIKPNYERRCGSCYYPDALCICPKETYSAAPTWFEVLSTCLGILICLLLITLLCSGLWT